MTKTHLIHFAGHKPVFMIHQAADPKHLKQDQVMFCAETLRTRIFCDILQRTNCVVDRPDRNAIKYQAPFIRSVNDIVPIGTVPILPYVVSMLSVGWLLC